MSNQQLAHDQPTYYRIIIQGRLDEHWRDYFDGLTLTTNCAPYPPPTTTLVGSLADQAALHGVLRRLYDLGLPLLAVQQLSSSQDIQSATKRAQRGETRCD